MLAKVNYDKKKRLMFAPVMEQLKIKCEKST